MALVCTPGFIQQSRKAVMGFSDGERVLKIVDRLDPESQCKFFMEFDKRGESPLSALESIGHADKVYNKSTEKQDE